MIWPECLCLIQLDNKQSVQEFRDHTANAFKHRKTIQGLTYLGVGLGQSDTPI